MPDFYFYVMARPNKVEADFEHPPWSLTPKKREVTDSDWAYLESTPPHQLHAEYQMAAVMTTGCNLSIGIRDCEDKWMAERHLNAFRAMSCALGVEPFMALFVGTHPLDALSGVSEPRPRLNDFRQAMSTPILNGEESFQLWWNRPALNRLPCGTDVQLDPDNARTAFDLVPTWRRLRSDFPELRMLEEVLVDAPMSGSYPQATLSAWGALESLFSTVQTEVSFRMALYLTQLVRPSDPMSYLKSVRKAYSMRSKIAHGSANNRDVDKRAWQAAWQILCDATLAVTKREGLPTEEELTREMLTRS